MKPEIVKKNEIVLLHYEVPGIVLTLRGKALESGAEGDIVNVLNVNPSAPSRASSPAPAASPSGADRAARLAAAVRHRMQSTTVSAMSNRPRLPVPLASSLASGLLGGCAAIDRLKNVGEQPELSAIENPTAQPGYKPVQMPMPAPQPALQSEFAVAQRLARLLQGPARACRSATS